MISTGIKEFDELLKKLDDLRKGIEKGAEDAMREVSGEYYERVKARLLKLADEYKGQEPAYVETTMRKMAENLKLFVKMDKNGHYATLGWEDGKVADLEHILYGNREILPVDVFGGLKGEIDRAFKIRIHQKLKKFIN
jgi:hypothetical protein